MKKIVLFAAIFIIIGATSLLNAGQIIIKDNVINDSVPVPTFTITLVTPTGESIIRCRDDEYILTAALKAGVELPYETMAGVEPSSAGRLISGMVNNDDQSYLDHSQLEDGFILLDTAYPMSNCVILTHQAGMLD
ncbi:hypothetical protein [Sphingobacterium sp. MYb388]|uniref:hypothetical protein n=1 Tax=Sphingobacterium sp. MYb388 TaxID=2745437 RepID=UPI0030A6A2E9